MTRRLVIFLVRKKLGLKIDEKFQFVGQKSKAVYWFTKDKLLKDRCGMVVDSGVSLNYLLDNECSVNKLDT